MKNIKRFNCGESIVLRGGGDQNYHRRGDSHERISELSTDCSTAGRYKSSSSEFSSSSLNRPSSKFQRQNRSSFTRSIPNSSTTRIGHFYTNGKTGDFRYAVTSQNMNDEELARFRTQICPKKATDDTCLLEERCPFSHCLSWHRRTPQLSGYRPTLCPNVIFSIGNDRKMRVKNFCRRGRQCLYSHTKEEQMYHPLVYKTQLCRDWPGCSKHFCPFSEPFESIWNWDY